MLLKEKQLPLTLGKMAELERDIELALSKLRTEIQSLIENEDSVQEIIEYENSEGKKMKIGDIENEMNDKLADAKSRQVFDPVGGYSTMLREEPPTFKRTQKYICQS